MILIRIAEKVRYRLQAIPRYGAVIIFAALIFFFSVNRLSVGVGIGSYLESMNNVLPKTDRKVVAFTFDDGPHPGYSEKILEILKEEGIKATFFVVGEMAEKFPGLLRQEAEAGHEIGNHTYSDLRMTRVSEERALEEIEKTQKAIKRITGKSSRLLRPPGGHYNGVLVDIAEKKGYEVVLWSLNSNDITSPPAGEIYRNVITRVKNEDVVIFHDGINSTIEALKSTIKRLKESGYGFVTVSELLSLKKERLNEDSWY